MVPTHSVGSIVVTLDQLGADLRSDVVHGGSVEGGRILLVRQSYRNGWGLPGGLLKRNEVPADAARREFFEELGAEVELVGEPVAVIDSMVRRVDVVFVGRLADAAVEPVPSSPEIVAVRWFGLEELPELQAETESALCRLATEGRLPSPFGEVLGRLSGSPLGDAGAHSSVG